MIILPLTEGGTAILQVLNKNSPQSYSRVQWC